MANGLIGGFGSFGQAQGQTQGNLLGGVFQQQPTRGELRRGLLSDLVQQYGGNAQQTGGAAIGAGLGIGISKLLGRDVQGAERADKIRRVQERVNSQFGDQFASDPYTAFTGTAQALFDEGLTQEAFAALGEAAKYKPEPVETERVIRGGTPEGDAAGLSEGESAIGTYLNGERIALKNRKIVEPDELRVGATGRFKRKNSDEVVTLVRTDRGLAEQVVGEDGQPTFNYVNSSDYEQVSRQQTDSRQSVTPTETQLRPYAAVISSNKDLNDKIKSFVEDAPESTLLGLNIPFTGGRDQDAVDAVSLQAQQRAAEIRSDNAELTIEQALEQAIDELSQVTGEPASEENTPDAQPGVATPENDAYAGKVNP